MPGPGPETPAEFSEREFYLREFRGRTLALAIPDLSRESIAAMRPALDDLLGDRCRVVLLAEDRAENLAELEKELAGPVLPAEHDGLEAEVWRRLREHPQLGIAAAAGDCFAHAAGEVARRLGVFKLVWIDSGGGLQRRDGQVVSFVHLEELEGLLAGEGHGLVGQARLALWREIADMLRRGLAAINVCSAEGLSDELFTYAGVGTLFTRERYIDARRLGVDDFDAAHDLIQRGVEEGYLAPRSPAQVDAILAAGIGAFVEGHHLAGIGALLRGADGKSGEIASLYTLTRFLGEGVGASLVGFAAELGAERGYEYLYACTTSERVGTFFERHGFRSCGQDEIPAAKWDAYDPERRKLVRCLRRELGESRLF